MNISGIISTKTSKSQVNFGEVRGWTSVRKQGKPNTFKNTPEDAQDTFSYFILSLSN